MLTQQIATRPRLVIRFPTLGTPDLTGADGHTVGSVLAGPKRVALLAYLALEGANGLVRRDSLLPLFWPESETDRARASLRSALLTLRRSLGEGVVVTRGDDEVGIGDSRLWCDAVEFRRLRSAGELEQARALANRLGAGHYVLGNILEAGGRLHLNASLYDHSGKLTTTAQVDVQDESRLFDLVDRLTAQLIAGQSRGPAAELTRLAALTTSSLSALKAYLQGERAFRQQRYREAIVSLKQAVELDSTFALAAYRLSIAADWAAEWELASSALDRAVRFRSELPPNDRLLVEALLAYNVAAPADGEARYRAALREQPTNVEAWYRFGELQFHDYPLIGRHPEQSRAAFERVLALDPAHEPARTHLARLAARRGDRVALDSLTTQLLASQPADSLEWQHLRAFASGDRSLQRQLAAGYSTLPDSLLFRLAAHVAIYTRDLEGSATMARHLVGPVRPADAREAGHLLLAYLETARGRPRAAAREIDAAGSLNPGVDRAYHALFATPHFLPIPEAGVRARRDALAAWRGASVENPYISLFSGLHGADREYLLGVLSARLGEPAAVKQHLAAMQAFAPNPVNANRVPRHLLRPAAVRARLAVQLGDTAAALRLLEERHKSTSESAFASVNYFQRHLRPVLLRAVGRDEEALRWYGAAPWTGSSNTEDALWDIVHLAPFTLRVLKCWSASVGRVKPRSTTGR